MEQNSGTDESRSDPLDAFRKAKRTGSPELRDELIASHVPFAIHIARRYQDRGVPTEDLRQVALVGLIKAVDRFDPEHGAAFTTFAGRTIEGEIKRYFRDKTWTARVPRSLKNLNVKVRQARSRLTVELGRTPRDEDIASDLEVSPDEVREASAAANAYSPPSLDQPRPSGDGEAASAENPALRSVDWDLERTDDRIVAEGLVDTLEAREQRIVRLRFWEGLTQREIADKVGLSQMHISRLLRRSLEQMRSVARRGRRRGRPKSA